MGDPDDPWSGADSDAGAELGSDGQGGPGGGLGRGRSAAGGGNGRHRFRVEVAGHGVAHSLVVPHRFPAAEPSLPLLNQLVILSMATTILLLAPALAAHAEGTGSRKNLLFIIADDLRPQLNKACA